MSEEDTPTVVLRPDFLVSKDGQKMSMLEAIPYLRANGHRGAAMMLEKGIKDFGPR